MKGNLQDWLSLYLTPGLGSTWCTRLVDYFGGPQEVFKATLKDLQQISGLRKNAAAALAAGPDSVRVEAEIKRAKKSGVSIIPLHDSSYPSRLREIHNPPFLLYVKGDPAVLDQASVGIVGARAATIYGQRIAHDMATRLSRRGLSIVSGLALGIDTAAHQGTLSAAGRTVAVLGCGLDVVYPPRNRKLYDQIPVNGALVSEYPFGTKPDGFRFPARNRIISGLCLGIVVVEAASRSGSLITAELALDQGREVFAVPGRIDSSKSEGSHRLLQEGAKLVHTVQDILDELPWSAPLHVSPAEKKQDKEGQGLSGEESRLFTFLDIYPMTVDEIITKSGFPAHKVSQLLLMLELKGVVEALPGKQFQKKGKVT
jgi:DNA processing protein